MNKPSEKFAVPLAVKTPVKIKIGRIRYVNMLPFFHGLPIDSLQGRGDGEDARPPIQLEFLDECPTAINHAMAAESLDIAPISSLAYLNHQDDFILFPGMSIGSREFCGSVQLFSKERIEDLDGETIAITKESLSSVTLLKVLLKFRYKIQCRFIAEPSDPDDMLSRHEAALVIGNDALFYPPKESIRRYDLSEEWWNWTGKPFCFALWAVRKKFFRKHPKEVLELCEIFRMTRDRNLQNLEQLLKDSEGLTFMDAKFSQLFGYLFNLDFGLDASMQEGLDLFYRLAHRLGVSLRPKPLEFLKP